jgi:DUF2934 family protein
MPREKNPETSPARRSPARRRAPTAENQPVYAAFVDPQQRAALIAQAAYFRAMSRNFEAGHELEDWLSAEAEVDAKLLRGTGDAAPV